MRAGHLALLVVYAALVASVFAVLQRDAAEERLRLGARLFGGLVVTAILAGWLMAPFPG